MNRDNIIKMAREAGFENSAYGLNCTPGMYAYNMEIVERFAALVAAAERKECAALCDGEAWRLKNIAVNTQSSATNTKAIGAAYLADAIRARSKT